MRKIWKQCTAVIILATAAMGSGVAFAATPKCGDNTGKPATGEPIVIGAITGRTGPDDFSSPTRGTAAYFKCLNANGGIKGRPVQYVIEDDQWNPELAAQLAAKLVNDRKAVLMVGSASYVECGANAEFYKKAGILVLAGVGVPRECFFAENIAPVNTGPRVSALGAMGYALEKLGAKKVVCIAPNIPNVGVWSCDGIMQLAKEKGYTAKNMVMNLDSADTTSTILQAAAEQPDAIILVFSKGVTIPLLIAAEEQGLHETIKFLSAAPAYDIEVPKALGPAWNERFLVNMEFTDLAATTPDNENWKAVMKAYAEKGDPLDSFSQAGYIAARVAEKALMSLDVNNMTREAVTAAVRKINNFQSDILCSPWYFADGQKRHNANASTRMAVMKGDKWQAVSECAASPDPELKDVRAYEKRIGIGG